jgi:hypothetical protein
MTPGKYNIPDHQKGDTFDGIEFTIIDYATTTPVDLTGATAKCQFRYKKKIGTLQADLSIGSGLTVTDAVNGVIEIDRIASIDWAVGTYYYDLEVTLASGDIKTYVEGTIKILQDVTT